MVSYYERNSLDSAAFRVLLQTIINLSKTDKISQGEYLKFRNSASLLMMNRKQYEGSYYDKKRKCFSNEKVQFFTEREWRFVPLPMNGEANYLSPEQYENDSFREEKLNELINNDLVLHFSWDDILEIGIKGKVSFEDIVKTVVKKEETTREEIKKKIKIL